MADSLTKISLLLSLAGIAALFFVVQYAEPAKVNASSIDKNYIGRDVAVNGTIKSLAIKEGNIFIVLDSGMRVVVFRSAAREGDYSLRRGNKIAVTGKVQMYKNELEIVAEKIIKIE